MSYTYRFTDLHIVKADTYDWVLTLEKLQSREIDEALGWIDLLDNEEGYEVWVRNNDGSVERLDRFWVLDNAREALVKHFVDMRFDYPIG